MTIGVPAYSTTPANNVNANTGINWDEGMSPGAVNNSARANMADLRTAFNDLIWFQYGSGTSPVVTPAYASGTSFTVAGIDVTAVYHAGRRVKAVGAGTGTIYGSISSSSFSTNTTVNVTWDSGSLTNEALTIYLSQAPVTGKPIPASGVKGITAAMVAGTTTNDSATAGNIGEYISSTLLVGSAVSLSSNTTADVTSISLTAGDWDVWGTVAYGGSFSAASFVLGWISATSATLPTHPNGGADYRDDSGTGASGDIKSVGMARFSLSTTTTIYLSANVTFSGTATAYGFLGARRAR